MQSAGALVVGGCVGEWRTRGRVRGARCTCSGRNDSRAGRGRLAVEQGGGLEFKKRESVVVIEL